MRHAASMAPPENDDLSQEADHQKHNHHQVNVNVDIDVDSMRTRSLRQQTIMRDTQMEPDSKSDLAENVPLLVSPSLSSSSSSLSLAAGQTSTSTATKDCRFCQHPAWLWLHRHGLTANNVIASVSTVLLILSWTGNSVAFKMLTNAMPNYPLFVAQMRVLFFLPLYWAFVLFRRDRWSFGDPTTEQMLAKGNVAKWKYVVMGVIDSGAGLLMVFGGNHTPGPLQSLLYQASIPLTMFTTVIFLRKRYKIIQYSGAFIILVGVIVSLLPALTGVSESLADLIWNIVFLSSIVPTALSSVFKEYCFRKQPIDIWELSAWVTLFQTIAGFILAPITAIPSGLSVLDLPANMWDGCKCLVGVNSLPTDACAGSWIYVSGYMLVNLLFNVFILIVLKRGSATLVYISSAVRLPLANYAFTLHIIMGDRASDLNIWIIAGLIVILLGLVIYKLTFSIPYLDDFSWLSCCRCCRRRAKGWTEDDCLGRCVLNGGDITHAQDSLRTRELDDWQFVYVMDSQQMVSWVVRSRSRPHLHVKPPDFNSDNSVVDRFVRAANAPNTV